MNKQRILAALEAVKTARNALTDEQALECSAIYAEWSANSPGYTEGYRVLYEGNLYRCRQSHTVDDPSWTPATSALWVKILPGQEGTAIGEWEQPGSENGYHKGDRVTHNGKLWESIVEDSQDGRGINTWEPGIYGWKEVVE